MVAAKRNAEMQGSTSLLAPGLLQALQLAVGLRFGLMAAGAALFVFLVVLGRQPAPGAATVIAFAFAEAAFLLALALLPAARVRLGSAFLPIVLGWLLLMPLVQSGLTALLIDQSLAETVASPAAVGMGVEAIWMSVPAVLAAWQYGRRGWQAAITVLAVGYGVLGLLIGTELAGAIDYLLLVLSRLGMVTLLSYIVVRLVSALRAEHQALMAANRQLEQRAATAEQLAESRERNRLARELHDTLAHSLTGLSLQLQALETAMDHDPREAQALLKGAQQTVRAGVQESRRAIQALRATPLEHLGLSEALRQLGRQHNERTGMDLDCDIVEVRVLDPLTEQAIFRIAEAALGNVAQHSAATKAGLCLSRLEERQGLRLEIWDNGVGFDPARVPEDRYGVSGMAERAELIGATLQVQSQPGEGSRVILQTRS